MTLIPRLPARLVLPLAAALAILGPAALAQPAPPGQVGPAGQPQQADIARLHSQLRLTAAQEPAWRAFVAASQPDAQQQARDRSAQQMLPTLTSPQRVDLSISAMEADLDTLRARGAALKSFYAALTSAQRVVFDRETLPRQEADEGP